MRLLRGSHDRKVATVVSGNLPHSTITTYYHKHDRKDNHNFDRNSHNKNSRLRSWESNDRPVPLSSETLRTEAEDKGLDSNDDAARRGLALSKRSNYRNLRALALSKSGNYRILRVVARANSGTYLNLRA